MKLPTLSISTRDGSFRAQFSERGLCALEFPQPGRTRRTGRVTRRGAVPKQVQQWADLTQRALEAVLAGQAARQLPPLDLAAGTAFQQRVWSALVQIPAGQTRSYAQVAADLGRPKAARAIGQACAVNPIPLLIPCHRVLAANQRRGGFSGGLRWKRLLLAREGVRLQS